MAMTLQPINTAAHKDVKINTDAGFEHIADMHLTPVTIHEFADVAANFPIVFVKDGSTGLMRAVALFGLEPGQNLFVRDNRWLATYIPNHVRCLPFVPAALDTPGEYAICLDAGSSLVGDIGVPLYNEDGSEAEILGQVRNSLAVLIDQEGLTQAFATALAGLNLLKGVTVQMADKAGHARELNGIFTVDSDRLHALGADDVASLHAKGFLGGAYAVIHSFAQLRRLVQLRNSLNDNPLEHVNVRDVEAEKA